MAAIHAKNTLHAIWRQNIVNNLTAKKWVEQEKLQSQQPTYKKNINNNNNKILLSFLLFLSLLYISTNNDIAYKHTITPVAIGGTLDVTGVTTLSDATEAASSTDAGTIVSGGLAVAKKINVGTDAAIGGTLNVTGVTTLSDATEHVTLLFRSKVFLSSEAEVCGDLAGTKYYGYYSTIFMSQGKYWHHDGNFFIFDPGGDTNNIYILLFFHLFH